MAFSSSGSLSALSVGLPVSFFPSQLFSFAWGFYRDKMQPCSGSLEGTSILLKRKCFLSQGRPGTQWLPCTDIKRSVSANVLRQNNKTSLQPRRTRATIDSLACVLSIVKACQDLLVRLSPLLGHHYSV